MIMVYIITYMLYNFTRLGIESQHKIMLPINQIIPIVQALFIVYYRQCRSKY